MKNWHQKHQEESSLLDKTADKVSGFFGAWLCVALHTLWFILWFLFKLDVGLLTNIVSLEAIYLSMIILMASTRAGDRDRIQAQHDYQVNEDAKKEIEEIQLFIARIEEEHLKSIKEGVDKLLQKKK